MPNAVTGSAAGPFIETLIVPIDGDPLLAEASGSFAGVVESFTTLLDNTAFLYSSSLDYSASLDTAIKTTGGSYTLSNSLHISGSGGGSSTYISVDNFRCDGFTQNTSNNTHYENGTTLVNSGSSKTVLGGALTTQLEQVICGLYGRVTQRLKHGPDSDTTISPRTEDRVIASAGGALTANRVYGLSSVGCTTGDQITVQNLSETYTIKVHTSGSLFYPNFLHGQDGGAITLCNAYDKLCQATFVYSQGSAGEPTQGWYVTDQVKIGPSP